MKNIDDLNYIRNKLHLIDDMNPSQIPYRNYGSISTLIMYLRKTIIINNRFVSKISQETLSFLGDTEPLDMFGNSRYNTRIDNFYKSLSDDKINIENIISILKCLKDEDDIEDYKNIINNCIDLLKTSIKMYRMSYWIITVLSRIEEIEIYILNDKTDIIYPHLSQVVVACTSLVEDVFGIYMNDHFNNTNVLGKYDEVYFYNTAEELENQDLLKNLRSDGNIFDILNMTSKYDLNLTDLNDYRQDFAHEISRRHKHNIDDIQKCLDICQKISVLSLLTIYSISIKDFLNFTSKESEFENITEMMCEFQEFFELKENIYDEEEINKIYNAIYNLTK